MWLRGFGRFTKEETSWRRSFARGESRAARWGRPRRRDARIASPCHTPAARARLKC